MTSVLLPFWVVSALVFSQAPPADDEEPLPQEVRRAGISIGVDKDGTARFSLGLRAAHTDRTRIDQALAQMPGCRVQQVEHAAGWWMINGQWELPFQRKGFARQAELDLAQLLKALRPLGVELVTVTVRLPRSGFIEDARTDADRMELVMPEEVFHSVEVA